jgi:hypothetical protein
MLQGLSDFVEGKITRKYWSPSADLDFRKLSALEALSRYQAVQPRMLGSISVTPNLWPTSAVLDWYAILSRSAAIRNVISCSKKLTRFCVPVSVIRAQK